MKRYNYNKLKGRIKENFSTQAEFAQQLGISDVSLSYKLNNKAPFGQDEIIDSISIFNLTPNETIEYFFTLEVDKKSTNTS